MYDLLIIGGGPAGLSAAMTARNRNLSVCVICGGAADSALYKAGHVTNYPGVPEGVQANLYLCGDTLIGGDIIATGKGGFQRELAYPKG